MIKVRAKSNELRSAEGGPTTYQERKSIHFLFGHLECTPTHHPEFAVIANRGCNAKRPTVLDRYRHSTTQETPI